MKGNIIKISIIAIVVIALLGIGFIAVKSVGNRQLFDFTQTFGEAIISLPDGSVVKGPVTSWKDFDDGDQIQVRINDDTYLTHISNVVLISD